MDLFHFFSIIITIITSFFNFSLSRFRHLPLPSLSSLVASLISLAQPVAVRISLPEQDDDILPAEQQSRGPPRGVLRAVVPDIAAVESFRRDFDPLFCLELLTNLVCVRLHAEESSGIAQSRGSAAFSRIDISIDHDPKQTTDGFSVPNPKMTFSNTLWPFVISYLESALRWYLVASAASRLPRIIPLEENQSNSIILPDGSIRADFESLPGAVETVALLKVLAVTTPKSKSFCLSSVHIVNDLIHIFYNTSSLSLFFSLFLSLSFARPQSYPSPDRLERSDLMFAERLIVSVLRLCVRLSDSEDPLSRSVLCGFLRLFAHLHSDIHILHTERIVAALHQLFVANHLVVADAYAAFMGRLRLHCLNRDDLVATQRPFSLSGLLTTDFSLLTSQSVKTCAVDETLISLLAVCQRCAPLKLPPFLVSKAKQTGSIASSSVTQ